MPKMPEIEVVGDIWAQGLGPWLTRRRAECVSFDPDPVNGIVSGWRFDTDVEGEGWLVVFERSSSGQECKGQRIHGSGRILRELERNLRLQVAAGSK